MNKKFIFSWLLAQSAARFLLGTPQALKPDVAQQLTAQYAVTRVGANGAVLQGGQVLVVQQDGIKANLASVNRSYYSNEFKNGKVTQSLGAKIIRMPVVPGAYNFIQMGAKVYLTHLEVKEKEIVLSVQTCGICNPAAADPLAFRSAVAFQFPKGYLQTADYASIQATIGKLFAIDTSTPPAVPTEPAQSTGGVSQFPEPSAAPVQATQTIKLGDSIDQVVTALGQPERSAKVANRDIYFYKDMKITFVDGKVSDIQ
jgi:hypothetical protein